MNTLLAISVAVGLLAGLGGCVSRTDVTPFPDLREPIAPETGVMTDLDRDAAIAELRRDAARNAAAVK